jgi:hypothetical protein
MMKKAFSTPGDAGVDANGLLGFDVYNYHETTPLPCRHLPVIPIVNSSFAEINPHALAAQAVN